MFLIVCPLRKQMKVEKGIRFFQLKHELDALYIKISMLQYCKLQHKVEFVQLNYINSGL